MPQWLAFFMQSHMRNNSITLIDGIRVGHAQDYEAITGCTVILCEKGAVGGVDQRGGAPGTRETDSLQTVHLVDKVHAVMLAGGSAFGLDASRKAPEEGSAGAGTGATVGKILGLGQAMKGGIGTAAMEIGAGLQVGAIVAVNAFGDVIDPRTNEIVAGARSLRKGPIKIGKGPFADTLQVMRTLAGRSVLAFAQRSNTVIGVSRSGRSTSSGPRNASCSTRSTIRTSSSSATAT